MSDALVAMIDRGRHWYRNAAIGLYAAAGCVVAIVAWISGRELYKQGPMVLVGLLLVMAVVYHLWYRALAWDRHPVLVALRTAPHEITAARVLARTGITALADDRDIEIARGDKTIMLVYHRKELRTLARVLTDYCPNIELDGL